MSLDFNGTSGLGTRPRVTLPKSGVVLPPLSLRRVRPDGRQGRLQPKGGGPLVGGVRTSREATRARQAGRIGEKAVWQAVCRMGGPMGECLGPHILVEGAAMAFRKIAAKFSRK